MRETNQLTIGILAHVDAGKTTLAESLLYRSGKLRKLGRVDHRNAYLDNHELERSRGITIFSKQAEFMLGERQIILLDTPGHVDFSAEMERTLQVLDYAILVISGSDGVQGHTRTLWRLLKRYQIPVFLFINKMDQEGTDAGSILKELQVRLDERCLDFSNAKDELFFENLALCDEDVLERYLVTGQVMHEEILTLIEDRKVFPCFFGSALKLEGVDEFLEGLKNHTECPWYPEEFGARVFKIARDEQGNRLTYLKITGGRLKVKDVLTGRNRDGTGSSGWEEKVDQIRIYSGSGYRTVPEAEAGAICAVTGLSATGAGEGLGIEPPSEIPLLEPVLTYRIILPEECDVHRNFLMLKRLEEEEPELHLVWLEGAGEIHAQVMGEVQIEVLKRIIQERFGIEVEFGTGSIVYKETIGEAAVGVGHFEPLRHYAEVHLLLEPGERGSGLQFASACSEDILDRSWQRLVLGHLEEKQHKGVLTGSEITDMQISLLTGRAHTRHTEGGDFRQAAYRAVRQGLKQAVSILLEPVYEFRLEVPQDKIGRAMSDIQNMHGTFQTPEIAGDTAVLTGTAPVVTMNGYQAEVISYTSGTGRFSCSLKGYEPCHNAAEVIAARKYDSELDSDNPTGSVFCAHGAGFAVPWYEVKNYQHLDSGLDFGMEQSPSADIQAVSGQRPSSSFQVTDEELNEIFTRTYGTRGREPNRWKRTVRSYQEPDRHQRAKRDKAEREYLLVDGYNIIFAWDELKELAAINIDSARTRLMDILCNYQGYKKMTLILVFDAYKVEGGSGSVSEYYNIHVVFTKEAETADQYIEKTVHQIGRQYQVTVATSDALEQIIIMGQGAQRMSARELKAEIEAARKELREQYLEKHVPGGKNYLFQNLDGETARLMEDVRLGKRTLDSTEE